MTDQAPQQTTNPFALWRRFRRDLRDMRVRHARERAALTVWIIEVEYLLSGGQA